MNNQNEEELKLINGQIIGIIFFIVTLIVSLLLTYNEKLQRENKPPLFTNKKALDIAFLNRLIVVLLGLYFLYTLYKRKDLGNNNLNNYINLEIIASWLAFLASAIVFYIVFLNYNNPNFDVSEIEEPIL